jgi:hypothetical protein
MSTYTNEIKLSLREQISSDLAFRDSADDLFNHINDIDASKIVVDFSGVESITRSFAHQYIMNKVKSDKQIVECDIPSEIEPMFELVERQRLDQRKRPTEPMSAIIPTASQP